MPSSSLLLPLALFLLFSPSLVHSVSDVDQAEYFGFRLGQNPFCDSECLPHGRWEMRRDWVRGDLDNSGRDSTFIWAVDGDFQYWSERCGSRVNDMLFGNRDPNTFILQSCFPGIIYLFEYIIDYDHEEGLLEETLVLNGAFTPTQEAWDEFVELVGERIAPNFVDQEIYTLPWTLFRIMPSLEGGSFTNQYNGRVLNKLTFVANYERNCCTFVGSALPIDVREYCDYDEDLSSDQQEFVSYLFCEYFFDTAVEDEFHISCGSTDDNDVCDRIYVGPDESGDGDSKKRSENLLPREPRKRMWENIGRIREEKLKNFWEKFEDEEEEGPRRAVGPELMATVQSGAKVEVKRGPQTITPLDQMKMAPGDIVMASLKKTQENSVKFEQERAARQQGDYMYQTQPVAPLEGGAYSGDSGTFYYVPYTSSIVAPYCAYKEEKDPDATN